MNTVKRGRILILLASTFLLTSAFAATPAEVERAMSYDGLQKVTVKDIDLAFARPGASLAGYNRVKIEPVDVAFRKDWNPKVPGTPFNISAADRESIRTGVAKMVYEEFVKELQNKSTYKLADEAGPDVLQVKVKIVNLYVNAPAAPSAGVSRQYTVSAGEMTLYAELYDSETGQVLARVVDRREGRGTGRLSLSNSAVNTEEFRSVAAVWARVLRNGLDKAHAIGKT